MSIPRLNSAIPPERDPSSLAMQGAAADEAVFQIKKKRLKVQKKEISSVATSLAEIAYSMGATNDVESLKDEMTEDILKAFQIVAQRRKNRPIE